jgi:hypothetical protein
VFPFCMKYTVLSRKCCFSFFGFFFGLSLFFESLPLCFSAYFYDHFYFNSFWLRKA